MFTEPRKLLRSVLSGYTCISPASVFDPLSMRIAQELRFPLAMLAGSTAALSVLGAPDIMLVTLTEFADLAARITRAAPLPLLVDADHGYGHALSAMRCVQELERAGVAGMTLEDTDLPQPFGTDRPQLVSREEGVGKVRAALAARQDPAMVIVGRTSAITIAGMDEALARARLYTEAKADALFFTGVDDLEQLRAIQTVTNLPIILGGSKLSDNLLLAAHGVRIALRGHQPIQAAAQAVFEAMKSLRDGTPMPHLARTELLAKVTREVDYKIAARSYLGVP